ncbi:MAG TPA: sigma 54-interacting transcriptional regulator [Terriglobales bacterium]|nr:sigma 54-interacting transcriptional regulator [Terriglobales bacterium]
MRAVTARLGIPPDNTPVTLAPDRLASGKKAWDLFLATDIVDRGLVRSEVADSWERCRVLRVDPTGPADSEYRTPLLEERRAAKEQLCRVARPFMQDVYCFVRGSKFQVVLTDEDGLLLEVLGDPAIVSRTKEVNLCPGGTWSEAAKGTNAIGTALVEKRPVQIHAWEHFREENHFLTCAAAPIRDAAGNVLGVLDVSGDCGYANPHTLGMVVAAVRAIENQISLEQLNRKLYVVSRYSTAISRNISDGLIAVDGNGIVVEVNPKGAEIFCVNPISARGKHLSQICGPTPLLSVLADGKEYENREVVIERVGKRVSSSASALRDETGTIVGAVAVFHEVSERSSLRRPPVIRTHHHRFDDIVGESRSMQAAKEWAQLAAQGNSTVLLLGESGTGKELFANAIHSASARRDRPFVAINCAAMPETLIESELFGYSDGSFTGARRGGQPGKFEIANGGTVFLDEIGDMSLNVQAKLLRVLQEKKVARLGSASEIPVDARIISATHNDLKSQVESGRFREDLYYRLAVLEVRIPALRERAEDVDDLAKRLVQKIGGKLDRKRVDIEEAFFAKLHLYPWPGNVRELENVIERAIVRMGAGDLLTAELLQLPNENSAPLPRTRQSATGEPTPDRIKTLREVEKTAILEALSVCQGNIQRTASRLGIGRNTLYRKLEEYALLSPGSGRPAARLMMRS